MKDVQFKKNGLNIRHTYSEALKGNMPFCYTQSNIGGPSYGSCSFFYFSSLHSPDKAKTFNWDIVYGRVYPAYDSIGDRMARRECLDLHDKALSVEDSWIYDQQAAEIYA